MKYRIEFNDGQRAKVVDSRECLMVFLSRQNRRCIEDIRKIYKSGVTDSVLEKYQSLLLR